MMRLGLLALGAVSVDGQVGMNIEVGDYLAASVVTAGANVVDGHTAYRLMVNPRESLPPGANVVDGHTVNTGPRNVYAIFGREDATLTVPKAFHVAAPFGTDFAGVNPAFYEINADSQWDSWLTVAITQGDTHNLVSSIGIDWTTWTEDAGLSVDDGAVFWMDPDDAPEFADRTDGIALGQVTVLPTASASDRCVVLSAQGRSHGEEEDWEELSFRFALGPGGCGAAHARPPPSPPPQHHPKPPPPPAPPVGTGTGCNALDHEPGFHISYRQPATKGCTPGHSCREFADTTVAMITCTPPYQLIKQDVPDRRVLSFAESMCRNGEWSPHPVACELPAAIEAPTHAPPPAPPAVRPTINPHATCTMDGMMTRFSEINDICCTRAGIECADSAPPTCSTACRDVVLDLWRNCQSLLQQMPPGFTALDDFVEVCSTGNGNQPGGVSGALDSLKTSDGPALAGSSQVQYGCTYSELTGIALQCSTADPSSLATFCASHCASQLVPWASQCQSTMQVALDTLGLADTFDSLIDQCNPATDGAHVCPMAEITAACERFNHLEMNPQLICSTPCVETVGAHYDACSASTDPHVRSAFSATTWKPIVDTCNSLHNSGSVVGNEVNAQCALIRDSMSTQLNNLCCGGSECSDIPEFCSTACSDSLLPYYRDCASQLSRDEPALFGRLTELATSCTHQNGRGGHR